MTNILLLCLFLFYNVLHPLHLSVTEIEHDANKKALEMTMRIFLDDLEASIRNDLQKPDLDITAPGPEHTTNDLLEDYLRKHFKINAGGKELTYEYLGHEVELPVIYLYVQSSNVKKVNDITIYNDIIMDTYDDQANLVHVKVHGKVKSLKLSVNKKRGSLSFQ
jgi:hypothetical protein